MEKKKVMLSNFAFIDYKVNNIFKIAAANCRKYKALIEGKHGTTSVFVNHLPTSAHTNLRQD